MASTVGDLMTTHVVAAFEEAGFKRLAVSLRMNGVSALPVLDADQRVVGVVSESDLLAWLAAPNLDEAVFAGDMPEEPVARGHVGRHGAGAFAYSAADPRGASGGGCGAGA